jgi:F-box-like
MDQLPTNILIKIFGYLNNQELVSASSACKKFNCVILDFMGLHVSSIGKIIIINPYNNLIHT